ncbi:addiction module antidote protein [Methylobacterium sp. SyP6R]|uniref:addiction module antidote protein n=1 Tax=Methylobacterium sp. SyP6R TaxID=2718876 RepID=UPI001F013201|nr:addiction module antidote protein [Methylobacterium sp. SyP6R]MCF4125866.1 putative addiction module antidote protein [Methylobacterium sp. SyP6R]
MAEEITDYDFAAALQTDEAIAVFLSDAFETGDASHIATALEIAVRAKGEARIASTAGMPEAEYDLGNPTLATLLAVMKALGVGFSPMPVRPAS